MRKKRCDPSEVSSLWERAPRQNSLRPDEPYVAYLKQHLRHPLETLFSQITQRFPQSIHAVTMDGFLLKIAAFIIVHTLESAFIV